jgi:hypothetical protein
VNYVGFAIFCVYCDVLCGEILSYVIIVIVVVNKIRETLAKFLCELEKT